MKDIMSDIDRNPHSRYYVNRSFDGKRLEVKSVAPTSVQPSQIAIPPLNKTVMDVIHAEDDEENVSPLQQLTRKVEASMKERRRKLEEKREERRQALTRIELD